MTDLDEDVLKAEIDRISQKIDTIMERVDRLYPSQPKPAEQDNTASKDKSQTPPDRS